MLKKPLARPLWLEINLKNLDNNIAVLRKIVGKDKKIIAVIKADAYGHGAVKIAQRLEKLKIDYLAVASLEEAIELRENKIKLPVLVLGYIDDCYLKEIVAYQITPTIFSLDFAKKLNHYAKNQNLKVKIQIKIDTGMNRLGFPYEEAGEIVKKISKLENLKIEGIFSHLACSKEKNNNFNYLQFQRFKNLLEDIDKIGIKIEMKHLANSGGIVNYPEFILNTVRPGELLYGFSDFYLNSKNKIGEEKNQLLPLKPLLSFKSKIISLKKVKKNEKIGYDQTYRVLKDSTIAVIPVGYADGYPRLLSNLGEVLIKGQRAKIVGIICMDLTMVDVSNIKGLKVLDEVILIGKDKNQVIKAPEIAKLAQTIPDEIVSRLGKRVPKVYLD